VQKTSAVGCDPCVKGIRISSGINSKPTCIYCNVEDCIECEYGDPNTCLKCRSDRYLKSNACIPCDKEGLYIYINCDVPECKECSSDCLKCESGTKCLECRPDMRLVWSSDGQSNSCEVCSDCDLNLPYDRDCYLYQANKRNCVSNCKLCSNHNQCKKCNDGYFLEDGGSCCTKCPDNCALCIGDNFCTKCNGVADSTEDAGDYYLFGGYCIRQCAAFSTYVFPTDIANAHTATYSTGMERCKACPPNCSTCSTDSLICDSCATGYFLLGTNCAPNTINTIGFSQLKLDGFSYACQVSNCAEYLSCGKCTKCQNGFYVRKSDSHACLTCDSNTQKVLGDYCYEVSDCGISNCLQCGSANTCEDNRCASRFFRAAAGHCEACTTGCLVCDDQSSCCTCDTPTYKLQVSKCVLECHDGYYLSGESSFII
jgi:proprotein convertase subtilisin/kexin type 5